MKVHIDVSVLIGEKAALGMVSGELDLLLVPPIGSSIALTRPAEGVGPVDVPGFNGLLKVEKLLIYPVDAKLQVYVTVMLEDIIVYTEKDGKNVMDYLERGFGLFSVEY